MTFRDLLRDSELLVWVDNVPMLSVAMNGYSHSPEMADLSNTLHLVFTGLLPRPLFLHVPGRVNPADIPSRVPFVRKAWSHVLDPGHLSLTDACVVDKIGV
jgi:hypothetical protein